MTLTKIKPAGLDKPVDLAENEKIRLGTDNHLQIYHNTHSYITHSGSGTEELLLAGNIISLNNAAANEYMLKGTQDGSVELYHNGTLKFETTDTGVKVSDAILEIADTSCLIDLMEVGATNGNHRIRNGSGNFYVQHITDDKSTTRDQLKIDGGTGVVELYHDGTKMFQTSADGVEVIDNNASVHVRMISSDGDAGYLYGSSNNQIGLLDREGDWLVLGNHAGSTNLYYDYSNHTTPKLKTTATGVEVSGNVKISSSGGINFHNYGTGTNVQSNLFDDYEEGTWTPAWKASGTNFASGEITYHSNTGGRYVKIGKQVTVWMYIQIATINTSNISGSAEIINLPFTASSEHFSVDGATLNVNYYTGMNGMGSNVPSGYVELNQTEIRCHMVGGNSQSAWNASYLGVGGLYACATYMAA